jgi:hypothetical protein
MCQDMASPLHVLTVWVARFPPVSAAMILRPAGLYYHTVLTQWPELSACCTDPHNHACLVPFTKLQHDAIELLKMQIPYALVSGILCPSVDLNKVKCRLRSVDSGSSLLLCFDSTGCRNYCQAVAKSAQRWLCKGLGSESLLWLLHLLAVFLFLEALMWMFKLRCHATHLFCFDLNNFMYCLLASL